MTGFDQNRLVIARAYGDEPVLMLMTGAGDGFVEMAKPETPAITIRYPSTYAYAYEAALFDGLRSAWEHGDRSRVSAIYRGMRVLAGAGNAK